MRTPSQIDERNVSRHTTAPATGDHACRRSHLHVAPCGLAPTAHPCTAGLTHGAHLQASRQPHGGRSGVGVLHAQLMLQQLASLGLQGARVVQRAGCQE